MESSILTRRSFIAGTIASVAVAGNAFGLSRPRRLRKIGVQLYMVRRQLEKDFEGTLAHVANLGFQQVEFFDYFNHRPKLVKTILDRYHLAAPSMHVQLPGLQKGFEALIDACHILGHKYILFAWMPPEARRSLDDYKRLADLFNRTGDRLRREQIIFGYHNHDFEFVPMEGRLPYDVLLERTDPQLVKLEMDLYWIAKAGSDPLKYFAQYPGRYHLVHVKDMDATPKHDFTELGRGVIDFKTILARAREAGVKFYFIEQDETPGDPFDSMKISIDYLRKLEF